MNLFTVDYLSIDEQIQNIKSYGIIINGEEGAKEFLNNVGYQRFREYALCKYKNFENCINDNITFESIKQLYLFDRELSLLVFDFITQIEISLKTRLVNALQCTNDPFVLHNPSIWDNKELYWKIQNVIALEISRAKENFIDRDFKIYKGNIPIWDCIEVLSLGTIFKLIKNLKHDDALMELLNNYKFESSNKKIVYPSKNMFLSWLISVKVMRNVCAHNGRIYGRAIDVRSELIASDKIIPQHRYCGFYEVLMSMKYLRPSQESWLIFVSEINFLLDKFEGVYKLENLNFPNDWKIHVLLKQ